MSSAGPQPLPETPRPKLGIVIPLADAEATIEALLARVLVHVRDTDRVFCVLDTVSKDGTRNRVERTAARDPRVVLVWAPENRCVRDAYFRGYRAAFDGGCQWILEMDGGFSHLPEEIPLFIDGMRQGFDYVGGTRFASGGRHLSPWTRVLVSWGGTILARRLLRARMTDMTSGFECFNRKAMTLVLERGVLSRANFFQTEIRLMMHELRWLEVPIHYQNENFRIGRSSIREALRVLWRLRRDRRNHPS